VRRPRTPPKKKRAEKARALPNAAAQRRVAHQGARTGTRSSRARAGWGTS
jgi:hypothetical protein